MGVQAVGASGWPSCATGSTRGWPRSGITGELADDIYRKLAAFANYGFPESHAMSFAYLVYASAWLKRYHPAAFCAALLNAQPMGFYSPQTLVDDARRHGVEVRRPDINASAGQGDAGVHPRTRWAAHRPGQPPRRVGARRAGGPAGPVERAYPRRRGGRADRGGAATRGGPYRDMADLARRAGLHHRAAGGAGHRGRLRLLRADPAARRCGRPARRRRSGRTGCPARSPGSSAPALPGMDDGGPAGRRRVGHRAVAGQPPGPVHPGPSWTRLGAVPIARLARVEPGRRVLVGGIVTHRQRPATAGGVTFLNLEDETGMLNVTCSPGLWQRYRRVARTSPALVVRGRLERSRRRDQPASPTGWTRSSRRSARLPRLPLTTATGRRGPRRRVGPRRRAGRARSARWLLATPW